jgi:hypothetical protein
MAGSHTISKLTRTYALLMGEYEVIEREIEYVSGVRDMLREINRIEREKRVMLKQLDHIAATAKLIDPKWERERVRPVYPRKTDKHTGVISTAAYKVLREAGEPLRARQIARRAAEKLGMEPCERELKRLDVAIRAALNSKIGRTVLLVSEKPMTWALMPRDKVRSAGPASATKRGRPDAVPPL